MKKHVTYLDLCRDILTDPQLNSGKISLWERGDTNELKGGVTSEDELNFDNDYSPFSPLPTETSQSNNIGNSYDIDDMILMDLRNEDANIKLDDLELFLNDVM